MAELEIKVGEAEANEAGRVCLNRQSKILAGHEEKYEPRKGYEYPEFVRIEKIDLFDFAATLYPTKPEKLGLDWNGFISVIL
ncbi:hypothetical protein M1512_00455 [Patescibacteria group bacterium]|nr:hypothetical protein [Patescibacteria group bacterium]